MRKLRHLVSFIALLSGVWLISGCTTSLVLMHVHDLITEGDPPRCDQLNSVERALRPRCGEFVPGSLRAQDVLASGLPECPLTLAAREPQLWRVLPELLSRGALPERCVLPPLVALAQANPCPNFGAASAEERSALRWLGLADARSIHHDAVRLLSCPNARQAGLDTVLAEWSAQHALPAKGLPFSALGALHPSYLNSAFARELEAQGHAARAAIGPYVGELPSGFEVALREGDWPALDWWLMRVPELVNGSPAPRIGQTAWLPLAKVLSPQFIGDPQLRRQSVEYLLVLGADPWRRLPHSPRDTVVSYAREMNSPLLPLLDPASVAALPRNTARASGESSTAKIESR